MRRILQSKIGVALLCAVAALCLAANFVKLPSGHPLRVFAKASPPVPVAKPEFVSLPNPLQVAPRLGSWRELFPAAELVRDPFTLFLTKNAPGPTPASAPTVPRFVLQAVSIEGDRALAVLNGRILGVGESLGDFQVERIDPTSIQLLSRWSRILVSIDRSSPHGKLASGIPAAADQAPKPAAGFPPAAGR